MHLGDMLTITVPMSPSLGKLKNYALFWHIVKISEAARKLDAMQCNDPGRIIRVVCYPHHKYMNLFWL
jgi:hypothetical protein